MYSVVTLKLETGERLSCLTYSETGIPVRVANRWAVNHRRKRTQSSTLESNLRDIKLVYQWANQIIGIDLDEFITKGEIINNRQINSLADYMRMQRSPKTGEIVGIGSFNNRLNTAKDFFVWSLRSENRGGKSFLNIDDLYKTEFRISKCFEQHNISGNHSQSYEPLSEEEVEIIEQILAPKVDPDGNLVFPKNGFKPHTRLRNYLMFEFALVFGLRRSELLKLRLDCLPRGNDVDLKVFRFPDDPSDTRNHEPNVKSAERLLPIPKYLLALIRVFLTTKTGVQRPANKSPYLFLSEGGNPLSISATDDVIKAIGKISGVDNLHWHRLRHTWAENLADQMAEDNKNNPNDNSEDRLKYFGGWKNPASAKIYTQNSIRKQAMEWLRKYQSNLYKDKQK